MSFRNIFHVIVLLTSAAALSACGQSSGQGTAVAAATPAIIAPGSTGSAATASAALAFTHASFTAAQTSGSIELQVSRTGGIDGAVSVSYATSDGSAFAGVDYGASSGMVSWSSGDAAAKSISIPISNHSPFANTKSLQVTLTAPTGGAVVASPSIAVVTIRGSAAATAPPTVSAGTILLTAANFSTAQSSGTATITAVRAGGSKGSVSVNFATSSDTAKAGTDFTAVSGTLTWPDGVTTPKSISVPINTAVSFTGSRSFVVALAKTTGGATLAAPASANVTINGSGSVGVVTLASATYTVSRTSGALTVTAARAQGSIGAVSVDYATADRSAKAGTDYTAVSGTLSWGSGDNSPKSFKVPVISKATSAGSRAFAVSLMAAAGATLGSPNTATATITGGPMPGTIALSSSSYNVGQSAGVLDVVAVRSGGSSGVVSLGYATADGSAKTGVDYAGSTGTLTWADGDSAPKSVSIPLHTVAAYAGSRNFTITLAAPTGGAALGSPASATITIAGSTVAACGKAPGAWLTTGTFASKDFGNYVVNNNNWGNLPGQQLWVNDQNCWGVVTTSNVDSGSIRSYPSVTRGWTQNDSMMLQLSTPGTNDWTTKAGMGIAVTALSKAKIHWAFNAPTTGGTRWLGLMDIYFHQSPTPSASTWPPYVDLMIDQSISDQVSGSTTYYALVAKTSHATTVTLAGNQYLLYIDNPGEASYHQAAGHDIHLFQLPTSSTGKNANPNWGVQDSVTDLAAIVKFFMQSNPVDDAGNPLQTANGSVVTQPLIASGLYLDAINAGWEIDTGASFTNTAFCVAMQNEADCP